MDKKDMYMTLRENKVTKANELIQKSRFNLTLLEQKIVLYLISQISPEDETFKEYRFNIQEFCRVCGINDTSGKHYKVLKESLKNISDKSLWITLPNGKETLIRWVEKPYIEANSGTMYIRLDKDMAPFLLQLKNNFTTYELIYTLHFKSKYTIRLYELIRSIHFHEMETYTRKYTVTDLKKLLNAENYKDYRDFKKRSLKPAIEEINEYSDKDITFKEIKDGRSVSAIEFTIDTKPILDRLRVRNKIDYEMDGNLLRLETRSLGEETE